MQINFVLILKINVGFWQNQFLIYLRSL